MRYDIKQSVERIKKYQKTLTDQERIDLWYEITKGYCKECGDKDLPCYCLNEE